MNKSTTITPINPLIASPPATTALVNNSGSKARADGLNGGANVVMPDFTPVVYIKMYEIYPRNNFLIKSGTEIASAIIKDLNELNRPLYSTIKRKIANGQT